MCDNFRIYLSNAHQLCCEGSPTKCHWQTDDHDLQSRSKVRLKLDYLTFLQVYIGQYVSYYIQTWHDGRLMDAIYYAHARLGDLDPDARSQWVSKGIKSALHALAN